MRINTTYINRIMLQKGFIEDGETLKHEQVKQGTSENNCLEGSGCGSGSH